MQVLKNIWWGEYSTVRVFTVLLQKNLIYQLQLFCKIVVDYYPKWCRWGPWTQGRLDQNLSLVKYWRRNNWNKRWWPRYAAWVRWKEFGPSQIDLSKRFLCIVWCYSERIKQWTYCLWRYNDTARGEKCNWLFWSVVTSMIDSVDPFLQLRSCYIISPEKWNSVCTGTCMSWSSGHAELQGPSALGYFCASLYVNVMMALAQYCTWAAPAGWCLEQSVP